MFKRIKDNPLTSCNTANKAGKTVLNLQIEERWNMEDAM